jgi:hypothetical protein
MSGYGPGGVTYTRNPTLPPMQITTRLMVERTTMGSNDSPQTNTMRATASSAPTADALEALLTCRIQLLDTIPMAQDTRADE